MIKFTKNIVLFFSLLASASSFAQSSTNSVYSQFGLGQLSDPILPQNRALGGTAAGIRRLGIYNNINLANPAAYSAIKITTFDVGLYTGFTSPSKGGITENNFTGSFDHLNFAVPVSKNSALSFGILPYSTMGYSSRITDMAGTDTVNYVTSGKGGLSKAYIGYGYQIGKHFSLGANVAYTFGRLEKNNDTEFPSDLTAFNTRNQEKRSAGGLTADYGLQFFTNVSKNVRFTLGYSGTAGAKLNSDLTRTTSRYTLGADQEYNPIDSTFSETVSSDITLPITHRAGFVFEKTDKWLIAGDVTMGQWSNYREGSVNPGLKNSFGAGIGAQITPDVTAVGSYLKLVDYRFGFRYDKSYINYRNNDIKQYALTLGLGLPLPANRSTFYKINIGTELGQRGGLSNGLVRERFANIYLGFTINDKWFQRYKFD